MKRFLGIAAALATALMLAGCSSSSTSSNTKSSKVSQSAKKATHKKNKLSVTNLEDVKKDGQFKKYDDGTVATQVTSGPEQTLKVGPFKIVNMGWDIMAFKNVSRAQYEYVIKPEAMGILPLPDNFKFKPGMNIYWLNLLPDYVENTSDKPMTFNGLINEHYLTPSNEQVSINEGTSDYSMDDYTANAKKSQSGMAIYLGDHFEEGTYKFTTGSALDVNANLVASGVNWTIDVKTSAKSTATTASSSSSSSSSINFNEYTLTSFVKKYGESPVAYKQDHMGMSEKEALKSTPDELQTSGENQTEWMMDRPDGK